MTAAIEPGPVEPCALQGGSADFRAIHDRFRPRVLRYLKRLLGEHDAEDLAQVVMLKVSDALAQFRGDAQLATWIYRIATNTALDRLRSTAARSSLRADAAGEPDPDLAQADSEQGPLHASIPSAEATAIRTEMNACIGSVIDRLPEPYRAVVVLSEIEGFKNREIAEILGVSVDSVKTRLHRAREKLKRDLEADCNFIRDEQDEFACDRKLTRPSPA